MSDRHPQALSDVSPGDMVAHRIITGFGDGWKITKVGKVTKRTIAVATDDSKFYRSTGEQIGKFKSYEKRPYITCLTKEVTVQVSLFEEQLKKLRPAYNIRQAKLESLSLETLEQIVGLIEGEKK